jgi:hypothetical protein
MELNQPNSGQQTASNRMTTTHWHRPGYLSTQTYERSHGNRASLPPTNTTRTKKLRHTLLSMDPT